MPLILARDERFVMIYFSLGAEEKRATKKVRIFFLSPSKNTRNNFSSFFTGKKKPRRKIYHGEASSKQRVRNRGRLKLEQKRDTSCGVWVKKTLDPSNNYRIS